MLQVEQLGKSYNSKMIVQDLQLLAEGTLGELQELVGKSTNLETVFLHLTGRSLRD